MNEAAHVHQHRFEGSRRRLQLAFWTQLAFFGGAGGGILTNSLALLADAGHMLSDVGALGLSLLPSSGPPGPPGPKDLRLPPPGNSGGPDNGLASGPWPGLGRHLEPLCESAWPPSRARPLVALVRSDGRLSSGG